MNLCSYGCGNVAKYLNKSNRYMCESRANKCPVIRKKNSEGLKKSGRDYKEVYKNISSDKKQKMAWNKGNITADFCYAGKGNHKGKLIQERGYFCEDCKNNKWMGKDIVLELEHIDGDNQNNNKDNLKLLCPNCHSLTPTWKRGKTQGWKKRKHTDNDIKEAIDKCENLHQTLKLLGLGYGSAKIVIDVMSRYKVNFKN